MKKTIYSTNHKKIIGLIFILLGTICTIDSLIGLIGYRTKSIVDYEYYSSFIEVARVSTWILLAVILKKTERVAAMLKAAQLLLMIVVLPTIIIADDMTTLINMVSVTGILAYVLFVMSKSLSPFRVPAIIYLIAALWYITISAFAKIPGLDGITHLLPITRLFYLAGGIVTIVMFCKWDYSEETTTYATE